MPLSRSYLKCPVKTIALYYQSACPTYFLSTLQPTLLYSDSFLVTWVDVVQDIGFFKDDSWFYFIFLKILEPSINGFHMLTIYFNSTDVFLISLTDESKSELEIWKWLKNLGLKSPGLRSLGLKSPGLKCPLTISLKDIIILLLLLFLILWIVETKNLLKTF